MDLLEVKYEILEIDINSGKAKVKFLNPYKENEKDELNIDHVRSVSIPLKEGKANAEEFEVQLKHLSNAQSNKMLLAKEKNKTISNKDAFADILKMGKNIEIVDTKEKPAEAEPVKKEKVKTNKTVKTSSK